MKKIFITFIIFTFTGLSQSNFDFEFDYAQFGYDSSSNFLELYYSFNQASLKVTTENAHTNLQGLLKIFIKNSETEDTVVFNQWKVQHEIDTSLESNQMLVGTLGFIIPKGNYHCQITGSDLTDISKSRVINEEIKIIPFLYHNLNVSDIQLASKMIQGSENKNSIFYKNSYEVIPIPNLVFGKLQPVLFFYIEIYNLQSELLKSSQIKMSQMLYNSRGKLVKEKHKYFLRNSDSRVEVGSQILTTYPTDAYTLVISLIDSAANIGVSTAKKFFVYNPDIAVEDSFEISTTSVLSSAFGSMSEEELDDLFDKSRYIASKNDMEKYVKLNTIGGKREFMYEFWKAKDENSSLPENEYFRQYLQRVALSNERFTSMGKPGWKTDRGRIYLLYGEPTEIERYPNQLETRPYEIWQYTEIEGGIYFVFGDLTGFSDYTLINSTKRGELRDDNWLRRITIR